MFATLFYERAPLRLEDVPAGAWYWVQTVGGFAMVGLLIWLAAGWPHVRPADRARIPRWQYLAVLWCTILAAVCYLLLTPLRVFELYAYSSFGERLIDERFRSPTSQLEVAWSPAVKQFE